MKEIWKNSSYPYQGSLFSLRAGKATLENGQLVNRDIIEHKGGAAVVPVLDNKNFIFVKQFRISVGRGTIELPGGRFENNETPDKTVKESSPEEYINTIVMPIDEARYKLIHGEFEDINVIVGLQHFFLTPMIHLIRSCNTHSYPYPVPIFRLSVVVNV